MSNSYEKSYEEFKKFLINWLNHCLIYYFNVLIIVQKDRNIYLYQSHLFMPKILSIIKTQFFNKPSKFLT
jgi:hypothetical protein